jgi:hypothetical protein
MLQHVRRLIVDLAGFMALLAPLKLGFLPRWTGLVGLLIVPVVVSFARGVAERAFLAVIPSWLSTTEWSLVLAVAGVVACIPDPRLSPHDQFWVNFGFFWFLYIVPSLILGAFSYVCGVYYGGKRYGKIRPSI